MTRVKGKGKARCLNCKQPVLHTFCSSCGQRNAPMRQPVWRHLGEFLGAHLSLDARGIRTAVPFILRPGFLTREFNEGRRVRYTAPLKLYLMMSLLLFLGLAVTRFATNLALFERAYDGAAVESAIDELPAVPGVEMPLAERAKYVVGRVSSTLSGSRDGYEQSISGTVVELFGEDHAISRFVTERMGKLRSMDWAEARLAGFDNWLNLVPTAMFLLLPFCALLLKVCLLGTGRYYSEHLVFSLHLHAFIYLVMLALSWLWTPRVIALGTVVIVVYILVGLRTAYRITVPGTLVRGVGFLGMYVALLVAGLGVTFWLSLLMI